MRILITNDDGINAPGLKTLEAIARAVAGPEGEVWTVAPAFEQSGVGHCISYIHPTMIVELGPRRFAAEGTPADCVLAAVHHVLRDVTPDLVLSGVNRGNNSGENMVYSGTLGGAMEGALQGLPAIALSQFYGPGNAGLADPFEAAAGHGATVVRALLEQGDWSDRRGYRTFYNVNFPPVPSAQVKGVRVAAQGRRDGVLFRAEAHPSPSGRQFVWVTGGAQAVETGPGTDVTANLAGYVSITPVTADLTAHDALDRLAARLDHG